MATTTSSIILKDDLKPASDVVVYSAFSKDDVEYTTSLKAYADHIEPLAAAFEAIVSKLESSALGVNAEDQMAGIRRVNNTILKRDFVTGFKSYKVVNTGEDMKDFAESTSDGRPLVDVINIHAGVGKNVDTAYIAALKASGELRGATWALPTGVWAPMCVFPRSLDQNDSAATAAWLSAPENPYTTSFDHTLAKLAEDAMAEEKEFNTAKDLAYAIVMRRNAELRVQAFDKEVKELHEKGMELESPITKEQYDTVINGISKLVRNTIDELVDEERNPKANLRKYCSLEKQMAYIDIIKAGDKLIAKCTKYVNRLEITKEDPPAELPLEEESGFDAPSTNEVVEDVFS